MQNKRGISPLIATVLVIGFTVALGAIIMLWGGDFVESFQEKTEASDEMMSSCAQAMIDVTGVEQQELDLLAVTLENLGPKDIKSVIFRITGSDGTASKTYKGLGSAGKKDYQLKGFIDESGAPIDTLQIIPTMDIKGKPNVCTPGTTLQADNTPVAAAVQGVKASCGNGAIDSIYEECDGMELGGQDCLGLGYTGGTLGCDETWCVYDTSSCTIADECGNGVLEAGEDCEIDEFGLPFAAPGSPTSCADAGYEKGDLYCTENCKIDTTYCTGTALETCGDNTIDPGETCDGTDLGTEDCISQGFTGGALACQAGCDAFDTSGCTSGAVCGDNNAEGAEVCDGTDLSGEDCVSQGFTGGTLSCQVGCDAFDTSGCTTVCGNGIKEGTEECDGTDFGGQTAEELCGSPYTEVNCNPTTCTITTCCFYAGDIRSCDYYPIG